MSTLEKVMTTQEVANRLVELCRKGEIIPAQEELFADDIISTEAEGSHGPGPRVVSGKNEVVEKGKQFSSMIEEVHESHISDPIVAGKAFSITWLFDVTIKGMGRQKMEEICTYVVKDGKVASEQFFS